MKPLSRGQFNLFLYLFAFFSIVSVPIWNMMGNKEDSLEPGEGRWHALSVCLLVLYGFYILVSHFRLKGIFIHRVCAFWCIMMLVVIFFNPSKQLGNIKLFLWPLIFEMSYISILSFPRRLTSIRKIYWIIFVWGAFLFLTSHGGYKGAVIPVLPNAVFTSLLAVPILMLLGNRRYQFFVLLLITLLVLISMKRSSMLIIAASWFAYVFPVFKMNNKLLGVILAGGIILIGAVMFKQMNDAMGGKIEERINREETDTGKNRLAIWGVTISMIQQSSIKGYLVGHGHFGVKRDSILDISAHTDILEVIYDYGLITFALYLGLWVYVLKRWLYLRNNNSSFFFPYSISVAIFVIMSLVSHLILYAAYFNFLVMFWGITEGMIINRNLSAENKNENTICDKRLPV